MKKWKVLLLEAIGAAFFMTLLAYAILSGTIWR